MKLTWLAVVGIPAQGLLPQNVAVRIRVDGHLRAVRPVRVRSRRAHVDALVRILVADDKVVVLLDALIRQCVPENRIHVAELRVLLQTDRAAFNFTQPEQPDFFQVGHLERDQCVVVEERPAADDRQIREELRQGLEAVDAVQEQEVCNLDQAREGEVVVLTRIGIVDEQDLQGAFYHRAVHQQLESVHRITHVRTAAHCKYITRRNCQH